LTQNILFSYFGKERCELTDKVIDKGLETITSAVPQWRELINISFLSSDMQKKYNDLLNARLSILKLF
jgi:serine/threonine-protein kinase HipA